MAKLKNPLLSLKASGTLARVLTFVRRGTVDLVEKKPEIKDVKSAPQLAWRTMFNLCKDLWHELSAAEKAVWESQGTARHMTGYAWYISQCLRPNPGIYLPLAGGTMSGNIDMAGAQTVDGKDVSELSKVIWKDASELAMGDANRTVPLGYTDLDLTPYTSGQAKFALVQLYVHLDSYTDGICYLIIRKNGTAPANKPMVYALSSGPSGNVARESCIIGLDAGQVIEYSIAITGTARIDSIINVLGYIE